MHPETLKQFECMLANNALDRSVPELLVSSHHFHIRQEVARVAEAMASHEIKSSGFAFPLLARLPAATMTLTVDYRNGPLVFLLANSGEYPGFVGVFAIEHGEMKSVGFFRPGSTEAFRRVFSKVSDGSGPAIGAELLAISMILSLINEPRIIDAATASGLDWSRQHRKAVERVTGKAAMAFSVVSWKIGKRAQAIGNRPSEDGHPKALHWCRAHWRRAEEGQPKAEWVNIPRKGGWGWYCWAADCWKGHPNFGIKLQRHEPHLDGEPRSRFVEGEQVLDATRFAAMGAAQRSALVEAGFAPSARLH